MCSPLLVIGAAVQIGGQVANHVAQNKASKANKVAAMADMRLQYADVNARQVEEQKAAAGQIQAGLQQKDSAQGTALAAAAGAGVGGLSVEALINTIEGDAASYKDSVQEQLDLTTAQAEREKRGITAGAANRIASVPKASILGTGLKITGIGVDAYARYKATQPNNPKQG